MQVFTSPTFLLALLFLITCQLCCEGLEWNKEGPIYHLCGDGFKDVWDDCCGNRCGKNARLKRTSGKIMSAAKASGFLESSSSQLLNKRSNNVDAVEECCNEGCSLKEVSEYSC